MPAETRPARFGRATQLVAPEEKGKPSFPADERRRTSAIYAILAGASGPLSVPRCDQTSGTGGPLVAKY